jgi:site-specific recombinase XerD
VRSVAVWPRQASPTSESTTIRHAAATLLLKDWVRPKVVQELLAHISITVRSTPTRT